MTLTGKEAQTIWKRIDTARRWAEKEVHPDLRRACELYDGKHWPNMKSRASKSRIVYNVCFPAVETKVANLAFNYPAFTLKPLNSEGADHASVAEHVIKYDWRVADAQGEARRALRDREIYGVGLTYDFWLWETEPAGTQPGVKVEGGRPAEAMEQDDLTPDPFMPPPLEEVTLAVRTDRPAVKRISPFCFFVSPECDAVLANAEYCGFAEFRPVEEVKRDKRFKNTRELKGLATGLKPWLGDEDRGKDDSELPPDCRRVKLYHYFERSRKLHAVYCDEHQKPLMVEPWRWDGDWYPFCVNRTPDEEDRFFPCPPLLRVEHQQLEINEARTQHSQWRKQAAPKFQTRGTLDQKQRLGTASGVAGTVVENCEEPIEAFPQVQLQPQVMEAGQMAQADMQFALGLNAYEMATPPTKRMTAPETEAVRLSGGSRAVADRQAFEMFCSELASHFLAWEQQYSVRSRSLPIFDKDERLEGFRDYTREEIRGEYLVEVAVGSTTAPKTQDVLEGIGFLLQSLPGFVQSMAAAQQMGLDLRPLLPRLIKAALPEMRDIEQELLQQISQPQMAMGMMPQVPPGAEMAGMPPVEGGVPDMSGGVPAASGSAQAELAALLGGLGG